MKEMKLGLTIHKSFTIVIEAFQMPKKRNIPNWRKAYNQVVILSISFTIVEHKSILQTICASISFIQVGAATIQKTQINEIETRT